MEVEVNGVPVYYEVQGEGRPLLLLHGRPVDHHTIAHDFEPVFEQRTGWKRIYPDLPGMGKTPAPDWITNEDAMLEVVLGFIDAVIGNERFAVAGSSYGGYLARGVAYRRAAMMDGLLLHVPAMVMYPREPDAPPPTVLARDPGLRDELTPDERGALVVQSRAALDNLREFIVPAMERADHAFLERLDQPENAAFSFDVDKLPEPFAAPALFLMGRQDHVVGYRDAWGLLEDYPRATFAALDRAGHFLGYEQESLFRTLAGEWLDRVAEFAAKL